VIRRVRPEAQWLREAARTNLWLVPAAQVAAAIAVALPGERASMGNAGAHGLSEVLYAFTSSANSNGSAFGGFNSNTTWYNVALGLVMLIGRYLPMFVTLTGAGALVLVGLTFLPALALGPLAEGLH
jgi:K+-transporting ATPase ATPase A chain